MLFPLHLFNNGKEKGMVDGWMDWMDGWMDNTLYTLDKYIIQYMQHNYAIEASVSYSLIKKLND